MTGTQEAVAVSRGTLVRTTLDGVERRGIKVERDGNHFVHHYLAPLDHGEPADGMTLLYLDPEHPVVVLDDARLDLGPAADPADGVAVGAVLVNNRGTFLKLLDPIKGQMSVAFVDLDKGQAVRRQEKAITAVHRDWTLVA